MSSFADGFFERIPISQTVLRSVRGLGEFKGKQTLFARQFPQILEALRQTAVVQSTESSNRIEGVVAPPERIRALMDEKTTPRNRSEQEIAGYRDVLNTIHGSAEHIPLTNNILRQFHRDLFKYTDLVGGNWKPSDNSIRATEPDGTSSIVFQPVAAHLTPSAMEHLEKRFNSRWQANEVEKLLLVPVYLLDFLCVHPFNDGNGRMARLLTVLLLYKAGFDVARYISLEKIIERTKESYYETLQISSRGWHDSAHDVLPWVEYFLGVLLAAYGEFEDRVGALSAKRGAKGEMVVDAIRRLPNPFRIGQLQGLCPGVSLPTIRNVLNRLKSEGEISLEEAGRNALWRKHEN